MPENRKVIRAFLASPGDLKNERLATRDVVQEFNDNLADFFGYQIELMGWEDTVSRHGRPQAIINQDLDRCELFIGMMWKKWGTPPDPTGDYTSGFHEEFERSLARRNTTGQPEICLYFKKIPPQFLDDKGPDLLKVIEFKEELQAKRTLLYQEFSDTEEISKLIRKRLISYVIQLRNQEEVGVAADEKAKRSHSSAASTDSGQPSDLASPLSSEGYYFLRDLLDRTLLEDSLAELTTYDIARFRLLSNSISKPGNDERQIGVHDLNILFSHRATLNLGALERTTLVRAGFDNLAAENVPLWHWYAVIKGEELALFCSAFADSQSERVGAITVLNWSGVALPQDGVFSRDVLLPRWFSQDQTDDVRNAAVEYLANHGTEEDRDYIVSEYDRNDSGTTHKALAALIRFTLRLSGKKEAAQLVLSRQFDSMDSGLLSAALLTLSELSTPELRLALRHRNAEVRREGLNLLYQRGELTADERQSALDDDDAALRYRALQMMVEMGELLPSVDPQSILIRPTPRQGFGIIGHSIGPDPDGDRLWKKFKREQLSKLSETKLRRLVQDALVYDDDSYFSLADRFFARWGNDLRANVDDQFATYFAERLERVERLNVDGRLSDTLKTTRSLEESIRKSLMREGLNILCRKSQSADLERIRENFRSGYTEPSILDLIYLKRHGDRRDIERLARTEPPMKARRGLLSVFSDPAFERAKTESIYALARSDLNMLLFMDIPANVLSHVLSLSSKAAFINLTDSSLLQLLNNESGMLRRAVALLAVQMLPVSRLNSLLDLYVSSDQYRYYNSILWLDLGVSMPQKTAIRIARKAMSNR